MSEKAVSIPRHSEPKFLRWAVALIFLSLTNQIPQILNRQHLGGVSMHHAVAISTKRAKVGHWIYLAFTMLGQWIEVVNLNVRPCMRLAVNEVEVKTAPYANRTVNPDGNRPIPRAAFVSTADPKDCPPFHLARKLIRPVRCFLCGDIRLCLSLGNR